MPRKRARRNSDADGIQFVYITNPTARTQGWKRTVRSCAARNYYLRIEQQHQRTSEFQISGQKAADDDGTLLALPQSIPNAPAPPMLLRIEGVDPLNTLVRPTTRFESELLDHCTSTSLIAK